MLFKLLYAFAITSGLCLFGWLGFWLAYFADCGELPSWFSWGQYFAGAGTFVFIFLAAAFLRSMLGDD